MHDLHICGKEKKRYWLSSMLATKNAKLPFPILMQVLVLIAKT
jgi:hypothetical protein